MRAPSLHLSLLGAVLALISARAAGLDSGLAFAGIITDQFQEPLPSAVATLSSTDRVLETHVSADRKFRFENVPRGAYDLELKAPGFVRQRVSVDLSGADIPSPAFVLQVAPVPDVEQCGPQASVAYSSLDSKKPQLDGIVRGYDKGKPLQGAEVSLARVDDLRITFRSRSNDHGRFQFESLRAGRYNLRISLDGYVPPETKQLLVPRENRISVDVSMARSGKKLIVCE